MAASELLRMRVVAATLGVSLAADQLLYLFARDRVEQFYQKPLPAWLPARIIGPFLAYEIEHMDRPARAAKHRIPALM
jgi:hypothetical protein